MSNFEAEIRFLSDEMLEKLYEATTSTVMDAMESVLECFELPRPTLSNLAYIEHEHLLRKISAPKRRAKTSAQSTVDLPSNITLQETQPPPDTQEPDSLPSDPLWEQIEKPAVQSESAPHKEQKARKRVSLTIKKE